MSGTQSQTHKRQRIGILLCTTPGSPPVQFLDTAAADLFGMVTPEFLKSIQYPESAVAQGVDYEFLYIAETKVGEIVSLTAGLKVAVTVSISYWLLYVQRALLTRNSIAFSSIVLKRPGALTSSMSRGLNPRLCPPTP